MPKVIQISLSADSVANAIKELQARKQAVEELTKQLAKELAEIGKEVSQELYGKGIKVSVKPIDNGFSIDANGRAVCFLEFGAGVRTNNSHPFANEMPFEVSQGSWSRENAQQFVTQGYWIFGSRKYTYVTPTNAMYNASKMISEKALECAKKVFGND